MQNTLPNIEDTNLQYLFDLKGSQVNRGVLKATSKKDLR